MTHVMIAVGLFGWLALAFSLGRRAEARLRFRGADLAPASGSLAPLPWRAAAAAGLVAVLAISARPPSGAALCGVTCIALIAAAAGDARTGYLFDAITLPAALLVAALALWTGHTESAAWGITLLVGGFGTVALVSRGTWLGFGDVKALYTIGAAFGPFESLIVLLAASLCGIAATAITGRLREGTEVRFGPHLAAGAAFTLVAGPPLAHHWIGA